MSSEILKRILSSIFLIPLTFFFIIKGSYFFYFFLILLFLISCFEWHSMSKNKSYHFFGYLFLSFSFFCALQLRENSENNYWIFLIITIICILTDIGGFTFGKIFKGPKLTRYSPSKTYSGLIGGYLLTFISIPFIIFYNLFDDFDLNNFICFLIVVSSVSQFGDIVISYFKRLSKLKDTGKIIPGHGGLLDRIDGMIFAFPVSYLLISNKIFTFL
jgi:phosphatidate cytidylyltransferase